MTDAAARPVPPEIAVTFQRWQKQVRALRSLHVGLLVSSVALSVLTAAEIGITLRPFFAVGSAISVGILSALDLGVKSNGFRNAWRHMNAAMARYHSVNDYDVKQLIQAYEEAETLIGDVPSGPRPAIPQPTITREPTLSK